MTRPESVKLIDRYNHFLGKRKVNGEIGLEIEAEGANFPAMFNHFWTAKTDNSLRGRSIEYVLTEPIKYENVPSALDYLVKQLTAVNTRINDSDRCAVHVHVNVQQRTIMEIINYISLYLSLENILVHYCGEDREGNLFCLRSQDAYALVYYLQSSMKNMNFDNFVGSHLRYSSINLASLGKYGSLEFRPMRTPTLKNFSRITTWINILWHLNKQAKSFDHPRNIIESVSAEGPRRWLRNILGDYMEVLECPGMQDMLFEGIRNVQDYAYMERSNAKAMPPPRMEDMMEPEEVPPVEQEPGHNILQREMERMQQGIEDGARRPVVWRGLGNEMPPVAAPVRQRRRRPR